MRAERQAEPLRSRFLVELAIEASRPNELGTTFRGRRRIVYATGGRFQGPRLEGRILPGGGDMALVRPDGVFEADVRLLLETGEGALIHVTYRGLWHAAPGILERLLARQGLVDPAEYYLRTAMFFETSDERYLWLNKVLAVGVGVPAGEGKPGTIYQVHEIL